MWNDNQFGFVEKSITNSAILQKKHQISENLENKLYSAPIFLVVKTENRSVMNWKWVAKSNTKYLDIVIKEKLNGKTISLQ